MNYHSLFVHLLSFFWVIILVVSSASSSTSTSVGQPCVLGVDGGTEGIRCGVFSVDGKCLATASCDYKTTFPRPGWAEQSPEDWWEGIGEAVGEALQKASTDHGVSAADVKCVCVDTTSCSVVALDKQGSPLRPCLLWMDVRSGACADSIMELGVGDPALDVNCGGRGPLSAEWMLPKALWLKTNERETTWDKAATVCEYQDYLNWRLTGRWCVSSCSVATRWHWDAKKVLDARDHEIRSRSIAATTTTDDGAAAAAAAAAVGKKENEEEKEEEEGEEREEEGRPVRLLERVGLLDLLEKWPYKAPCDAVAPGEVVGGLTAEAACHLGLPLGLPVAQGAADAFVGVLGLGVFAAEEKNHLALITGSSHLHLCVAPMADGDDDDDEEEEESSGGDGNSDTESMHNAPTETQPDAKEKQQAFDRETETAATASEVPKQARSRRRGKKEERRGMRRGGGCAGVWGAYRSAPLQDTSMTEGGQASTGSSLRWFRNLLHPSPTSTAAAARNAAAAAAAGTDGDVEHANAAAAAAAAAKDAFPSYAELDAEASAVAVGCEGLLCVSEFQGSRTPVTDPLARGALLGLSLRHTRAHVWRALLEGTCLGTRAAIEALDEAAAAAAAAAHGTTSDADSRERETETGAGAGLASEEGGQGRQGRGGNGKGVISIAGGAARSPLWLQIHADCTGRSVVVGECADAPLLGCACLAAAAAKLYPSPAAAAKAMYRAKLRVEPDPAAAKAYDALYAKYTRVVGAVRALSHELAYE